MKILIIIDGQSESATLVQNSSAAALVERLRQGSVTYTAEDYGGFEKVGSLGFSLPQNNTQITTQPGDIILYQGSNLCLYYSENSWNFTPIGKIDYSTEAQLRDFLKAGRGKITVTLSLPETYIGQTDIEKSDSDEKGYRIDGVRARPDAKGFVIQKGRKTLK